MIKTKWSCQRTTLNFTNQLLFGFFVIIFFCFFPRVSEAVAIDNVIYPLGVWDVSVHHGEAYYDSWYHMGVDAGFSLGAGAAVYAIADGVVVEAQERSQFGLVVLIEHELTKKKAVSLYGHLSPSQLMVEPGQRVTIGEQIGVLGNSSENGGWSEHLHFGIHKEEYTGEWVYYGHVTDPTEADNWYDPEQFITKRFVTDEWQPVVEWGLEKRQFIGDLLSLDIYASDIGGGLTSLEFMASDNGKKSWTSLASLSGDITYPYPISADISDLEDGRVYLRAVALDSVGNRRQKTIYVRKKADSYAQRHVTSIKGQDSSGTVHTYMQTGALDKGFRPYTSDWIGSGDVAVGDITGNEVKNIVTVNGAGAQVYAKVYSYKGAQLSSFSVFGEKFLGGGRVATGDVDGDGVDEIVVGSGPGKTAQVKVFEQDGTLLWKRQPFKKAHRVGVDVAAGDIDGDGFDEVIVGLQQGARSKIITLSETGKRGSTFRAFSKEYKGGINVSAGDVDADGMDEIIVGSGGERKGTVRVFEIDGQQLELQYIPFGKSFTGPVDVASVDWDNDGQAEIIMSQAGEGEAWVKTYRYGPKKRILFTERVYEEGFEGGARIDSWK